METLKKRKQMITQVSALFNKPKAWKQINWKKCHRIVQGLQSRIVKATKAKQWGKVKSLQWILTHSFSAKALAVRKVTENGEERECNFNSVQLDHLLLNLMAFYPQI